MIEWKNKTIEGEKIEFKGSEIIALGLDLVLNKCQVKFNCSRSDLILGSTRFLDCEIQVTRKLKNTTWWQCYLENCRFSGFLDSHDFGRPSEDRFP